MSTVRVFTPRSTGISIAGGVLVAGAFGQFVDAAWGLAILNGLAAGALALVGSVCMRHGRFAFLTEKAHQRQFGVGMLTYAVMMPPMFFVDGAIGTGLLDRGDELALSLLFGSTAFAAYNLGGIMTMLAYLDGDAAVADPRLHPRGPPARRTWDRCPLCGCSPRGQPESASQSGCSSRLHSSSFSARLGA